MREDNENFIKTNLNTIILITIAIILIVISTFFIYSNLNKKSGLDGLFHLFKKEHITTEEAANLSKKYIELIYGIKVEDYNISSKDNKYYFSSNIADVVLDKDYGNKYFDIITTKETAIGTNNVQKADEIKEIVYEEIKPSIYLSNKETKKVDVKSKDTIEEVQNEVKSDSEKLVVEEIKDKIYVEDEELVNIDFTKEENINFENKINMLFETQENIDKLYKDKKNYQEKEEEENIKNVNEEIEKEEEKLNENKKINIKENKIELEKIINKKVNEIISFSEKESLLEIKGKEKTYSNSKEYKDALVCGSFEKDEKILVLKNGKLYLFKKVNLDDYIKNTKEKIERIETKAVRMKDLIFTAKEFKNFALTEKIDVKPDVKDIVAEFYLIENGIANKASYIKMFFNKQNEKLLEIKVNLDTIPYSEIKINKYDAMNISKSFLEKRGFLNNLEEENTSSSSNISDQVEYVKVEIDYINNFFNTLKKENGNIEKMWKIKFKNSPIEIYVDTYFGNILGGREVK